MASRYERCGGCGWQLVVPLQAQMVVCTMCNTVTMVQHYNSWGGVPNRAVVPSYNSTRTYGVVPSYNSTRTYGPSVFSSYTGSRPYPQNPGNNYNYYSQSPPPRPLSAPASQYGKKRALLCGINYIGKKYSLKGSINDVGYMKYFLVQRFGFPSDSILMLTENEADPKRLPTKKNMRKAFRWLVEGCRSGDSLVFHYSGHGSTQDDYSGDEVDGQDEALCPLDYETEGKIIDDEINATIVQPLTSGVKLHAIVDTCHSATVLDLPYLCRMKSDGSYFWEDHRTEVCYTGTKGGLAICFGACDDHQNTGDTTAFTGESTGAMTYSFVKAAQSESGSTYGRLLNSMRNVIREAKSGVPLNGPYVNNAAFNVDTSQEPQLSSSETFDIYSMKFTL